MGASSTEDAAHAIEIVLLSNVPLALWGAPGTGKTSLLRSIAYTFGWPLHTMTATIHDPTDFSGLRFLSDGTLSARTMRAPLDWAVRLAEEAAKRGGNGLVFFDDVAFAPLAVQNALLEIVTERRVDQFQLPAGVRCAAALDPGTTASNGPLVSAPLANRMVHLAWSPDASWWAEGFLSGWRFDHATLPADWEKNLSATRSRVAAFIRDRPALLNSPPKDGQSGAWPSGRTWDMLSRLLAACDAVDGTADVRRLLAAGAVGDEAGNEYLGWEGSISAIPNRAIRERGD